MANLSGSVGLILYYFLAFKIGEPMLNWASAFTIRELITMSNFKNDNTKILFFHKYLVPHSTFLRIKNNLVDNDNG